MTKMRMNQAISKALEDEMEQDETVVIFGEDIAAAGGPFKTSDGLLEEFGAERVRDTPISEMGFLGAAVGAAATGLRPVAEIMFIEFLGVALDQLVTEAAKFHYLSSGRYKVPLTIRASLSPSKKLLSPSLENLIHTCAKQPDILLFSILSDSSNFLPLLPISIRYSNWPSSPSNSKAELKLVA